MRAALALLLCLSCSSPPQEPCTKPALRDPALPLYEVGKPYSFRVGSGLTFCGKPSLQVSVRDENNDPVEVDAEVTTGASNELSAQISFTPMSPGPLHFTVRFDPNLAFIQAELIAAQRRDRPVLQRFARPDCDVTHVLPSNKLLCTRDPQKLVVVDGAVQQQFSLGNESTPFIWVSGSAVWYMGTVVIRWLDEGDAGLVQSPSTPLAMPAPFACAASATDAYATGGLHISVDGGAWSSETIRAAAQAGIPVCAPPNGGWWWSQGFDLCRLASDGGADCFAVPGAPLSAEAGGVWYSTGSMLGFRDEAGGMREMPLPTGFSEMSTAMFGGANQVILAVLDADGGMHWDLLDSTYGRGFVQGDRIYLVGESDIISQPR